MKTLVAILTSGQLEKLQRCIDSVLVQSAPSDIVIIINTVDERYENLAFLLAEKNGIKSVITDSNGKPGKGKNALISYFLSTDYTHVIPVDGDDYLYPNAISKLEELTISSGSDVLGLINGLCQLPDSLVTFPEMFASSYYLSKFRENVDPKNSRRFDLHTQRIREISVEYDNFFNRFVVISRNAAERMQYNEALNAAEDVKQGLFLKLLHQEGTIKYSLIDRQDIYLYDRTNNESVMYTSAPRADPKMEMKHFWCGITDDMINRLKAFKLECI
jgi:glycosyltransferase involved in cell wall biosynthesis